MTPNVKRQKFLDVNYAKTYLAFYSREVNDLIASYDAPGQTTTNQARLMNIVADERFRQWSLRFTAGDPILLLRNDFAEVVEAFLAASRYEREAEMTPNLPLFDFSYRDDYTQVLSLVSLCILLRQESFLPLIHSLFAGGAPDREDALVEDLLGKYMPNRPRLASGFHDTPYGYLLDATAGTSELERQGDMAAYLKAWYPGMTGTGWYESHKRQNAEGGGGYFGYWAFEAAAIAYLYDIDDTLFRNHLVYPKDLADFARSMPRSTARLPKVGHGRCEAGQPCPREGWWFTPARMDSRRHFNVGQIMPNVVSDYGQTIWQWDHRAGSNLKCDTPQPVWCRPDATSLLARHVGRSHVDPSAPGCQLQLSSNRQRAQLSSLDGVPRGQPRQGACR